MGQRTCKEDGCDRKVYGRGWCNRHYQQWYRALDHTKPVPPAPPKVDYTKHPFYGVDFQPVSGLTRCRIDGCERLKIKARGLCKHHYQQWRIVNLGQFELLETNLGRYVDGHADTGGGRVSSGPPKGTRTNTGRTHFKKGDPPPNQPRTQPHKCVVCGVIFKRHGRTRVNKYCSKPCQGLGMRGAAHPRWNGGMSHGDRVRKRQTSGFRAWRRTVLKRDNYKCVFCGAANRVMHVDHIMPVAKYPELIHDLDNGRTLCIPCHRETPTWGAHGKALEWF